MDNYTKTIVNLARYFGQELQIDGGPHPRVSTLKEWVVRNIAEEDLQGFSEMVKNRFEWFPKIAELERIRRGNPEARAEHVWQLLLRKSATDDVLIHDPYAYQVVAGYGSWDAFCQHRDKSPDWCRKEFVRRYLLFFDDALAVEPKPLAGAYRCLYGANFQGVNLVEIGSPSETRKIISPKNDNVRQISDMVAKLAERVRA